MREEPIAAQALLYDAKRKKLAARFDWWSIHRSAREGDNSVLIQVKLTDGRMAGANVTLPTKWDIK